MMNLKNLFSKLTSIRLRYFVERSIVIAYPSSHVKIDKTVQVINSKITIHPGSSLIIGKGSILKNIVLSVNGNVVLGENNILDNGYASRTTILVENGSFIVGRNNRIRSNIWIRFQGLLKINDYNNINEETEIRVDEGVEIGSYNQISYKCVIWDTNTHNIYTAKKRRELTIDHYPIFGYEYEKPKTQPVSIGNDCWIGRESSILKGVTINDECIIGYKTVLSKCIVEANSTVISKSKNTIISRTVENIENSVI